MAFQITDEKLESRLEKQAGRLPLRPAKVQLVRAILETVMDAADAEGISVGRILRELEQRAEKGSAAAA